jgi:hypothetical protein
VDERDVIAWPFVVAPRLGVALNLESGKTTVSGGYGRFLPDTDFGPIDEVNPNGFAEATVRWTDTNRNQRLDAGELGPFTGFAGGPTTRWDDEAERPYADILSANVQRALPGRWSIGASYSRTWNRRALGVFDEARPSPSYTPVPRQYPDPVTGLPSSITIYNLDAALVSTRDRIVTNVPSVHSRSDFWTVGVQRRFGNGWSVQGRFLADRRRGLGYEWPFTSVDLNDPNALVNRTDVPTAGDVPWAVQILGIYTFPFALEATASYTARAGDPLRHSLVVGDLTQVSEDIHVAPRGTDRSDAIRRLINLVVRRRFSLGRLRFEGAVDVLNLLNTNPVLGQIDRLGSEWGRPLWVQRPRIARATLTLRF